MQNEVKQIPFEGGELLGVRAEDGKVYLGVKKACLDIGLTAKQADFEIHKIKESLLFDGNHLEFKVVQTEGSRQVGRRVIGLSEDCVPMWLAQINLTPNMKKTNPAAVDKLLTYQRKAADALHEAFMPTEEAKQELYSSLGLEGEIIDLKGSVNELKSTIERLVDYATINHRESQRLLSIGRNRINQLLGGTKSAQYKRLSRSYFKNMWIQFCEKFEVSTYKDLSPANVADSFYFTSNAPRLFV